MQQTTTGEKMESRAKGLFYCHCPEGINDLMRCLDISRGLIHRCDLDFLAEGTKFNLTINSPHFRDLSLPPARHEPVAGRPLPASEQPKPFKELIDLANEPYDFFISELFPFGKWEFKDDIESMIAKVKKANPNILTICSLNDSLPAVSPEKDRQSLNTFLKYFDFVFLHSDPRIYQLEESFSCVDALDEKLIYTGFTNNPDANISQHERIKRIVVSTGSGRFGENLIYASIEAAPFYPDYEFDIVMGPLISPKVMAEIKFAAKKAGAENIKFIPFIQNFQEYLSESALSISLGGCTIMDAVGTKTPAIVLPLNFHDQQMRAIKFSSLGFIKLISAHDLASNRLIISIKEALEMPPPPFEVDMGGSQATCSEIISRLQSITGRC